MIRRSWRGKRCASCGGPRRPDELGSLCAACQQDLEQTEAQLHKEEVRWI